MNQKVLEEMKTLNKSWNKKRRVTARHPSTRANLGKTTFLHDLLASSKFMASERVVRGRASERRSRGERREGELAQMKRNSIGWKMTHLQLISFDDIPGLPAISVCRTFRNTMLTENGNIMITCTPFSGEEHDRSLLLWSVNDFWGPCGCIFCRSVWISISLNI